MSDNTNIEWTDATWNPVRGCSRVSPGCGGPNHQGGCYAEKIAARFSGPDQAFEGFAKRTPHGGAWTGKMALVESQLTLPLRWKKPRRIFVNSMSDLFHENLPDEAIDKVFAVMAMSARHTFQILTKRPERMRQWFTGKDFRQGDVIKAAKEMTKLPKGTLVQIVWPLPNVWLGVSVEDQQRADERIPHLLATPAAKRFLSCEPLLGPVDLEVAWHGENALDSECWGDCGWCKNGHPPLHNCQRGKGDWERGRSGIDWVIAGGESGPNSRPMHPDWARSLRDQCVAAGVPFFFKQWGAWQPDHHYCDRDAEEPEEPCDCRGGKECHITPSGHLHDDDRDGQPPDRTWTMKRVGKKAAGAQLDGREWREFPKC